MGFLGRPLPTSYRRSGERCKLPQRGSLQRSPGRPTVFLYFKCSRRLFLLHYRMHVVQPESARLSPRFTRSMDPSIIRLRRLWYLRVRGSLTITALYKSTYLLTTFAATLATTCRANALFPPLIATSTRFIKNVLFAHERTNGRKTRDLYISQRITHSHGSARVL